MGTDATTSDGYDAYLLVRVVAEFVTQLLPIGELGGIEAGDVAGEVEVLLSPFTNHGQIRAESLGHDVAWVPDEQRPIPRSAVPRDVLDHLGVVVGGQIRLARTAVWHRQPPREIAEPDVCRPFEFGIL